MKKHCRMPQLAIGLNILTHSGDDDGFESMLVSVLLSLPFRILIKPSIIILIIDVSHIVRFRVIYYSTKNKPTVYLVHELLFRIFPTNQKCGTEYASETSSTIHQIIYWYVYDLDLIFGLLKLSGLRGKCWRCGLMTYIRVGMLVCPYKSINSANFRLLSTLRWRNWIADDFMKGRKN